MNRRLAVNLILGGIFAAALIGVGAGMFYLRDAALSAYGSDESQAEWDRWKSDVARDAKAFAEAEKKGAAPPSGFLPPVKRRVSKAPEPPALLMMRDRFAVCFAAALLLSGAMLGSVLLLVRGTLLGGVPIVAKEDSESPER